MGEPNLGLDIEHNLAAYLGARSPRDRYASFDYCFNYFQSCHEAEQHGSLADDARMETSCLQLGFFLASWGMYRGSAILLQRSARQLAPVIEAIAQAPDAIWSVDADDYSLGVLDLVFDVASKLRTVLPAPASDTLVTKVMLGVFGCVPAFDTNFRMGSGRTSFSRAALTWVGHFYSQNSEVIERHRVPTLDFSTGDDTGRVYSRAKVIDMIFFVEGGG